MDTVQIELDSTILKAADEAARNENLDRSAFIQRALENDLKRIQNKGQMKEREERERQAYLAQPQTEDEYVPWEKISVWPED